MSRLPDNLRGALLMAFGSGFLVLNDAVTKLLTADYPVGQVISLRQIVALLLILAFLPFGPGWASLKFRDRGGQLLRGTFFVMTMWSMVLALAHLPLPTVVAIAFSSPLFVAALSVTVLGEQVGWRRWTAILVGLAGVMLIVRPGASAFDWVLLLPLLAALTHALRDLVTRRLSRSDASVATLFWSSVMVVAVSLPSAGVVEWQALTGSTAGLFVVAGALNMLGHFFIIESLRFGEAALVAPVRYSALIWAALLGFLIWGDLPDMWAVAGMITIAAGGTYMLRRGVR
jgi:drug/metabolite transporter (DMT)-like permease